MSKKRGQNYTEFEKQMFLQIVDRYKDVVEDKSTTGQSIQAKQQVWNRISKEYNEVAASGWRNWRQLRHLYDNLKQKARKKSKCDGNKFKYKVFLEKIAATEETLTKNSNEVGDESKNVPVININDLSSDSEPATENDKELKYVRNLEASSENLKKRYFRAKLNNALLERQCMLQKHKLEMQILRSKLKEKT